MSLAEQLAKTKKPETLPEDKPKTEEAPPADQKGEVIYTGEFRILNSKAVPIARQGLRYLPKDADEVACLEYQVSQQRINKWVK